MLLANCLSFEAPVRLNYDVHSNITCESSQVDQPLVMKLGLFRH